MKPTTTETLVQVRNLAVDFRTADAPVHAVKGVDEMARVVKPGGIAAAYAWDMVGGGFPMEPVRAEMRAAGLKPLQPPSFEASRIDALRELWTNAGFVEVETREIVATRTFADFEDFWETTLLGASIKSVLAELPAADIAAIKERVRARLPADASGCVSYTARANAVKGRKSA